jgi:hypothetical protein
MSFFKEDFKNGEMYKTSKTKRQKGGRGDKGGNFDKRIEQHCNQRGVSLAVCKGDSLDCCRMLCNLFRKKKGPRRNGHVDISDK